MSPDAETALDKVMDLLNRKLEAEDWVDIGHAIMVLGLAHLPDEERERLRDLLGLGVERGLALHGKDRQAQTSAETLH